MINKTEQEVVRIERQYKRGFITEDERYRLVVSEWEQTTKEVTDALSNALDEYNPIYMMANSGARGSMNQIRQLAGMRGLMANTSGKTIEIPIKSNFREGLSVLEYFISTRGARKGMADTALRTADSGYLTRRMVDVCQEVIIREEDCGTTEGVWAGAVYDRGQEVESFGTSIHGRFPALPITDPATGELLFNTDHMLMPEDAKVLEVVLGADQIVALVDNLVLGLHHALLVFYLAVLAPHVVAQMVDVEAGVLQFIRHLLDFYLLGVQLVDEHAYHLAQMGLAAGALGELLLQLLQL
jgi:hypothetical protein